MPISQLVTLKPNPLRYRDSDATTQDSPPPPRIQPGPRPNSSPLRPPATPGNVKFAPAIKRIEISRPREKKLAILRYWYHALVPDEKSPGKLRHVTRNEVIARYKVCFNIECGVSWCIMESKWHHDCDLGAR